MRVPGRLRGFHPPPLSAELAYYFRSSPSMRLVTCPESARDLPRTPARPACGA